MPEKIYEYSSSEDNYCAKFDQFLEIKTQEFHNNFANDDEPEIDHLDESEKIPNIEEGIISIDGYDYYYEIDEDNDMTIYRYRNGQKFGMETAEVQYFKKL
jgi:hypothetical protein